MIIREQISHILEKYDLSNITIGVLGGHSALDVCHGVKKYGLKTVAVCRIGREKTYSQYYRSRDGKGCIDDVILVDHFEDILKPEIQEDIQKRNTIFIQNRYFWVYFKDPSLIEKDFMVPIFGSREMLKLEERTVEKNQYFLLQEAGIRIPKMYDQPQSIHPERTGPVIVKVNEADRGYERSFFIATDYEDYLLKKKKLINDGKITKKDLDKAIIEEFILGAPVNFNYFYSPITGELELMGTDMRRQTNLDGILRLPADIQMEVLKRFQPSMIETGHVAVTPKESILEKAFEIGEKFVALTQKEIPPGIIGPFALQGAITSEKGREDIVIFDVSMRIPGSPGTRFTPFTGYLHGETISYGERIGMEIKKALEQNKLIDILT